MSVPVAFQGEVMLAGWSQTHNGGAKVTFWLQDDRDLEAFKAMTVAKGKTAGQRLAIVAVEIGDDEQPKAQEGPTKPKGGELAKCAAMLCQNVDFLEFTGSGNESIAREWILSQCDVSSRAEIDNDPHAALMFHEQVRKPFLAWKEGRA